MEPLRSESAVLRDLHRALVRRRFAQIEPKLRLELGALAVLIGAFLFWHTRVSFDGLARLHGPLAVLEAAAGLCAVLAEPPSAGAHSRRGLSPGPRSAPSRGAVARPAGMAGAVREGPAAEPPAHRGAAPPRAAAAARAALAFVLGAARAPGPGSPLR